MTSELLMDTRHQKMNFHHNFNFHVVHHIKWTPVLHITKLSYLTTFMNN